MNTRGWLPLQQMVTSLCWRSYRLRASVISFSSSSRSKLFRSFRSYRHSYRCSHMMILLQIVGSWFGATDTLLGDSTAMFSTIWKHIRSSKQSGNQNVLHASSSSPDWFWWIGWTLSQCCEEETYTSKIIFFVLRATMGTRRQLSIYSLIARLQKNAGDSQLYLGRLITNYG
jgi:hypothetical protein